MAPAGAPASAITATIANTEPYSVTIDNTAHSTDYLDYNDGNDSANIEPRFGTGAGDPGRPSVEVTLFPSPLTALVRWNEVQQLNGWPVSHYELWASAETCQLPSGGDTLKAVKVTVYVDVESDLDEPVCYYVRAVNELGVPGYWSKEAVVTSGEQTTPRLSVRGDAATYDEGDTAGFTVSAFPAPLAGETLTVNYTVTQQGDFVAAANLGRDQVTMDDTGQATITVATDDDDADEAHGSVTVTLDNGEGYTLSSARSDSVDVRDDETPEVFFDDTKPNPATVGENAGRHDVAVVIHPAPAAPLTIYYDVSGSSAESGDDYRIPGLTGSSGTVTARAGASTVNIPVQVVNDGLSETDETIVLRLEDGDDYDIGGLYTPATYTLVIEDDDGTGVSFAEAESIVDEDDATHNVRVNLNPAPTAALTINYTVRDVHTTRGTEGDYDIAGLTGNTGAVTVPANAAFVNIPVVINEDQLNEGDEDVILTLSNSADYNLGATRQHTITILDDDRPRASFDSGSSSYAEGDAGPHSVRVNLDPAPTEALTLRYGVTGTATRNRDYDISNAGTVSVPANAASVDIPVTIADNGDSEPAETVILTLQAGSNYTVDSSPHTLTITDDDQPRVAFNVAEASIGESGGAYRAVIDLEPGPHEDIKIKYVIANASTAAFAEDYAISNPGTVTARRGSGRAEIPITIIDDRDSEEAETVILTLLAGDGYTLARAHEFTLTIEDNDQATVSFQGFEAAMSEDGGSYEVTVELDHRPTADVTIYYETRGRATPGTDYTIDGLADNSGSVTVPAGHKTAVIPIVVTDDGAYEGDEMVVLALAEGRYTVDESSDRFLLTILDSSSPPPDARVVRVDGTGCEVYEDQALCFPTFSVYGGDLPQDLDVVIQYAAESTATLDLDVPQGQIISYEDRLLFDEDFRFWTGDVPRGKGETFTITARANSATDGRTSARIEGLTYNNDGVREGPETIIFRLVNGPGYVVDGHTEFTVTIRDGL